jgi:dipeptidyl aminopeptidase/acylaminoacyl peptidase
MRSSISRYVPAVLLAGFLFLETNAFAQWPPAAPQQQPYPGAPSPSVGQPQAPGPILLPAPGAPQGPSAPPRQAPTPPGLSELPTRIESEQFIVNYDPAAWVKDSERISPDGRRFAVIIQAADKGKAHASIDGRDEKSYGWARDLTFSGDSRHVAYVATVDGKDLPVVDSREGAFRGEIWGGTRGGGGSLRLNYDGTRHAFVARKGNAPAFGIVIDGVMDRLNVDPNDGAPVFSPDGKRLAYIAQEGSQRFVVLDGKPGAKYEAIYKGTLTFSPDGKRLAYCAGKGGMRTVVLDGAEGTPHKDAMVSTLRFSPDGTKLAYAAQLESGKWAIVVNGKAGAAFDYIGSFTGINWSPDSRRLAYAGLVDTQWGAVVDDAGFPYDAIASMVFSPDSRRAAFQAQTDGKWVLVVNAPDGTYSSRLKSDSVLNETLAFSPDGKYLLYGAMTNGRPHMVVNGQPAHSFYEAIWNINGGRILCDAPTSFSYFALKDGKIYLVRESVTLAP